MAGINLYDALTVASRRLRGCCAKTLNKEVNGRPKTTHVNVEAAGAMLTITVDCPVCGTKSVLETDGMQVKVERKAGGAAAEAPNTPPSH